MEEGGHFFVVVEMNVKYRTPARFDDLLTLKPRSSASRRPSSSTNTVCSAMASSSPRPAASWPASTVRAASGGFPT